MLDADGAGAAGRSSSLRPALTEGLARWAAGFAVVLALHVGLAAYLLTTMRERLSGADSDAITVELMPDPSNEDAKPDAVAGPKVVEQAAPTSDKAQADDPNPPAPDSPPPSETKPKPDRPPETTVPPTPVDKAELEARDKREEPPAETAPEAEKQKVDRQAAPSQASSGSAALLAGGKRPSPAAKATWAGAINTHIVRNRRYPVEARAKGWQGVARVRVTIDGNGHVLGRELVAGTGRQALDDEALALMQRSDPFPKPPSGMPTPIVMTVPVKFAIR